MQLLQLQLKFNSETHHVMVMWSSHVMYGVHGTRFAMSMLNLYCTSGYYTTCTCYMCESNWYSNLRIKARNFPEAQYASITFNIAASLALSKKGRKLGAWLCFHINSIPWSMPIKPRGLLTLPTLILTPSSTDFDRPAKASSKQLYDKLYVKQYSYKI